MTLHASITFDVSVWYASFGLTLFVVYVALAAFGFYTSLAGQPVFEEASARYGREQPEPDERNRAEHGHRDRTGGMDELRRAEENDDTSEQPERHHRSPEACPNGMPETG